MFYYDYYFFVLIIPAMVFAMWAQGAMRSAYARYSGEPNRNGMTGAQIARRILDANGLHDVRVNAVQGQLSDHYNPSTRVVNLSQGVYGATTVAAAGIAAHECGHAIQHAKGYFPLKLRSAAVPVTNIGSTLAIPILLVGFFFDLPGLVNLGLVGYSLVAIFQLITLPVEFNASRRAMAVIASEGLLEPSQQPGAQKVLTAAALTYVAALVSALAQLLRLVLIARGRSGRNNRR
ncbi:zinc metallopeptidase [Oscillospiraceae bacterium MB08-C2-2]|nr:zinc metallopeptidase [Oscillospiraceae bacterium MB08-C2-2]